MDLEQEVAKLSEQFDANQLCYVISSDPSLSRGYDHHATTIIPATAELDRKSAEQIARIEKLHQAFDKAFSMPLDEMIAMMGSWIRED